MATNDEIRAKDIIPHKTSFIDGDGFYGDGDFSFFMEADKLLELTAQHALADNVAPAFDATRGVNNPYLKGQKVTYNGKTYSFKNNHYGSWNASDVVLFDFSDTFDKVNSAFLNGGEIEFEGTTDGRGIDGESGSDAYVSINLSTSDYILCFGATSIKYLDYVGTVSTPIGFAFYDENKQYISGGSRSIGDSEGAIERSVNVPNGAYFFRTTYWSIAKATFLGVDDFYAKVSYAGIIQGYTETDLTSRFIFTENVAVNSSTGEDVESTIYKASNYIDVSNFKKIRLSFVRSINASLYGLAFYSDGGAYLSGVQLKVGISRASVQLEVAVPDGARFLRTTYFIDEETYGAFSCYGLASTFSLLQKDSIGVDSVFSGILVGSPTYYRATDIPDEYIHNKKADDIYAIYDNLLTDYSNWIVREADLGVDSTGLALRHYVIKNQKMVTNSSATPNVFTNDWKGWMDLPSIVVTSGVHGTEISSMWGTAHFVKELVESTEDWAMYIKSNFIVHIVPIVNPWGLANHSRQNANGIDINRDFSNFASEEARIIRDFVLSLKEKVKVILDAHSTQSGIGMMSADKSSKWFGDYIQMGARLGSMMSKHLAELYNDPTQFPYFYTWISTNQDTFHEWFNLRGIMGNTVECPYKLGEFYTENYALAGTITKEVLGNLIQFYGRKMTTSI